MKVIRFSEIPTTHVSEKESNCEDVEREKFGLLE